jgi:hypothetical protein
MSLAVRLLGIELAASCALAGLATWGTPGYDAQVTHNTAVVLWVIALVIYVASDRIAKRLRGGRP